MSDVLTPALSSSSSTPSPPTSLSIWAPTPSQWPLNLASLQNNQQKVSNPAVLWPRSPVDDRESRDVFSHPLFEEKELRNPPRRHVGAIGEGRAKTNDVATSPYLQDVVNHNASLTEHELLLRSLNLDLSNLRLTPSPAPPFAYETSSSFQYSTPSSTTSTTSSLPTPSESSIPRSYAYLSKPEGLASSPSPLRQCSYESLITPPIIGVEGDNVLFTTTNHHQDSTSARSGRSASGPPPSVSPAYISPSASLPRLRSSSAISTPFPDVPGDWIRNWNPHPQTYSVPINNEPEHHQHISTQGGDPYAFYEPVNFLHLLDNSATPPYDLFVSRIVRSSDQQASIFLQQKLKVASPEARSQIVDAVVKRGFEMMTNRFGNWAVQRCLEPPCTKEETWKIASVMKGRVVELAMNCYGTHVIQKALDSEESVKLFILSELLSSDPSQTLMNKHASHVWSRIMELTWSSSMPSPPPIFKAVNKALKGMWVDLACHETGSLVVQQAFENLEEDDKSDLVEEILEGFDRVVRDNWGSWVIQHLLEHGLPQHRKRALNRLLSGLPQYASDQQGLKSIEKAIKCGDIELLDGMVKRLCETGSTGRRAMIVDLSLNATSSQLVGMILPAINKEQHAALFDAIKKHVVTLKGSKSGSKIIWLFSEKTKA